MNTKHTPGPWYVDATNANVGDGFAPFGGCGCCGSPWINGENNEEIQANARLIAAAPDLLEAAERALIVLEGVVAIRREGDAISQLEAAIAKARKGA